MKNTRQLWTALGLAATLLAAHGSSQASDSFNSEFSHFVSGGLIAGVAEKVASDRGMDDRRWVGFAVSVAISGVEEGVQVLTTSSHRGKQLRSSSLDFFSNMAGAALGAWVTDRYILTPVVGRDEEGHRKVGVALSVPF